MNKLNIGDYVRTNKGEIGKLKELKLNYTKGKRLVTYYKYREVEENYIMFDNKNITQRSVDGSCYYLTDDELKLVEESIVKSSPNIIDLIEVGDYINGMPVLHKENNELVCDLLLKYKEENIQNVVTKESFENISYKVGE